MFNAPPSIKESSQSKLDKMENEYSFLRILCDEQKQTIMELKIQNEALQKTNQNLMKELKQKNEEIKQYEKNEELKEGNPEFLECVKNKHWSQCGERMSIKESLVEYESSWKWNAWVEDKNIVIV